MFLRAASCASRSDKALVISANDIAGFTASSARATGAPVAAEIPERSEVRAKAVNAVRIALQDCQ